MGLADELVSNWALLMAGLVALVLVLSGFLLSNFSKEISVLFMVLFLAFSSVFFKLPDRYSSIGGTDIGMASVIVVASTQGAAIGLVFAVFVTVVGGRLITEGPQFTLASTIIHILVALIASFLPITAGSFLMYAMVFIIAGHIIGAPTYIALGNPAHTQIFFSVANIIWNYVVLSAFGPFVFGLLI